MGDVQMESLDVQFQNIFELAKTYITDFNDLTNIAKAYYFAKLKHEGAYRIGGQPYMQHLIDTAKVLINLNAGPDTIVAGLLHDTVEDVPEVSNELIRDLFGEEVMNLVDSVTKVNIAEVSTEEEKNLTIKKIFLAMSKDVRTTIIKIADRLSNMRTLDCVTQDHKLRVSRQTLEIYAPVARCIGLNQIAEEMERLCLFYLDKEKLDLIEDYIEKDKKLTNKMINNITDNISRALLNLKIKNTIYKTTKEVYNIHKFISDDKSLEEIQDLNVIHVIVENNLDCYISLGVIHSIYKPLFGKMKDYISSPKYNMYQALHTLIITPDGGSIKVAIKTKLMDNIYNFGVASRWSYIENKGYDKEKEQREIKEHLNIIKDLDKINAVDGVSTNDYVSLLKEDVFNYNQYIYVYTPQGEVIVLPTGATVLDFAFKKHGEGGKCLYEALINGIKVSIGTLLKNGTVVNLRFNKNNNVTEEWLKLVATKYAKIKIIKALERKENKNEN